MYINIDTTYFKTNQQKITLKGSSGSSQLLLVSVGISLNSFSFNYMNVFIAFLDYW